MKHHKMNNKYILSLTLMLAAMLAGGNATAQVVVKGNVYGGGNEGPVLTNSEVAIEAGTVENYVFGAGYSAELPSLEVRDAGFTTNPNYNSASGMFEPGVFSGTTTFTWKNAGEAGVTLSNNKSGSDITNRYIYTNTNINTSNLGSVDGNVNLTIKGNSVIGTAGDATKGFVFGGGDQSYVLGSSNNVTVTLMGNTQVLSDVFGGGNRGNVEGSTKVEIKE